MIRDEQIARLMGAGALALLLGALGFQYFAHLAPCEMCHWQRWPHIAAAFGAFVAVPLWNKSRALAVGLILLAAIGGLIVARSWDMLTGWQPVVLSIVIIALLLTPLWNKSSRTLSTILIALVALSGLIGAYQTGMQYHLLPGPQACTAPRYILGSGAPPPVVRCDVPTWFLFGLAMPAYNAIFSFLIAGTGLFLLRRGNDA
jgi:disulfide bond formation protein DsbB